MCWSGGEGDAEGNRRRWRGGCGLVWCEGNYRYIKVDSVERLCETGGMRGCRGMEGGREGGKWCVVRAGKVEENFYLEL